jgi:hypothetical protein
MANTSGAAVFNLDLAELVEESFERCGTQMRTGYDLRTARRSLNLMLIEWANRGINLWTVEEASIILNPYQGIYAVPVDNVDILDLETRTNNADSTNQIDINLSRISEPTYATIPNKLTTGRPIQVYFNRQSGNSNTTEYLVKTAISATDTTITLKTATNANIVNLDLRSTGFIQIGTEIISYQNVDTAAKQLLNCFRAQNGTTAAAHTTTQAITVLNLPNINVWPTGDGGGPYTFVYWRMRRLQNAGDGINVQDIPFRLITCLVAGLAFMIAAKKPEVASERVLFLKSEYEQQWLLASQEDRDKSADRYVPRQMFY